MVHLSRNVEHRWRISIRAALVAMLLVSVWLALFRAAVVHDARLMLVLIVGSVFSLVALLAYGLDRDPSDFWGGLAHGVGCVLGIVVAACLLLMCVFVAWLVWLFACFVWMGAC